jgi:hypothetical protein
MKSNIIELFYCQIKDFTKDPNSVLSYDAKTGCVSDKDSICKQIAEYPENNPYWKTKFIKFGTVYEKIYDPINKSYQKEQAAIIYHYYILINIKKLNSYDEDNLRKFARILITIMQDQLVPNLYLGMNIKSNQIASFIKRRNKKNLIKILPWYIYKLKTESKNYYFDIRKQNFVERPKSKIITGKHSGGMIETNNLYKLIPYFNITPNERVLILIPQSMAHIWIDYFQSNNMPFSYNEKNIWTIKSKLIFTLELLFNTKSINIHMSSMWDKLIIHDATSIWYQVLKKLLEKLTVKNIWLINQFPLKYYYKSTKPIGINELYDLWNIWLNFNVDTRKKYKNSIIRYTLKNLPAIYKRVYFKNNDRIIHIDKLTYNYNKFELQLKNNFDECLVGLSINKENFIKLKRQFVNNLICFESGIIYHKTDIKEQIINKINRIHSDVTNKKSTIIECLQSIKDMYDSKFICMGGYKILNERYQYYKEQCDATETKLEQVKNYILGSDDLSLNTECKICYCDINVDSDDISVITYCGHVYCVECLIKSILIKNECPICRSHLILAKCNVFSNNDDNLLESLRDLDDNMNMIVITDYEKIESLNIFLSCKVLTDKTLYLLLNYINQIDKVIFITSNNAKYYRIIDYFNSFEYPPEIVLIDLFV